MLANNELPAAPAVAQKTRLAAALAADPRVRFACLVGGLPGSDTVEPGRPGVAVYIDPVSDADEAHRELAALLAAHQYGLWSR